MQNFRNKSFKHSISVIIVIIPRIIPKKYGAPSIFGVFGLVHMVHVGNTVLGVSLN